MPSPDTSYSHYFCCDSHYISFPFSHIQTGFSHFLSLIKIMIVKTFQILYFQNPLVKSSCLQLFARSPQPRELQPLFWFSALYWPNSLWLCRDLGWLCTQKTVCKPHWIQWLIFSTVHSRLCVQDGCSLHALGQWAHLEESWTWETTPSGSFMKSLTHTSPTQWFPVLFIRSTGNFTTFQCPGATSSQLNVNPWVHRHLTKVLGCAA